MKPTLVLVGRPNVGKSTLFNRLTRSRDAIVANIPGLTRDRHYGQGRLGDKPYLIVDTGGFEPMATEGILHEMAKQTRQAIDEADLVLFIVDGRTGLTPQDKIIAEQLRKTGRKLLLVDRLDLEGRAGEEYDICVDVAQAGVGDTVLVIDEGNGARQALNIPDGAVISVIVGIVDSVYLAG